MCVLLLTIHTDDEMIVLLLLRAHKCVGQKMKAGNIMLQTILWEHSRKQQHPQWNHSSSIIAFHLVVASRLRLSLLFFLLMYRISD